MSSFQVVRIWFPSVRDAPSRPPASVAATLIPRAQNRTSDSRYELAGVSEATRGARAGWSGSRRRSRPRPSAPPPRLWHVPPCRASSPRADRARDTMHAPTAGADRRRCRVERAPVVAVVERLHPVVVQGDHPVVARGRRELDPQRLAVGRGRSTPGARRSGDRRTRGSRRARHVHELVGMLAVALGPPSADRRDAPDVEPGVTSAARALGVQQPRRRAVVVQALDVQLGGSVDALAPEGLADDERAEARGRAAASSRPRRSA